MNGENPEMHHARKPLPEAEAPPQMQPGDRDNLQPTQGNLFAANLLIPSHDVSQGARSRFDDAASDIFIGPDGLRPIWRLFLYFAMSRCLYLLLDAALLYFQRFDVLPLWWALVWEVELLAVAFVPAWILSRPEGRTFADYGLPARNAFGRLFWTGAVWGISSLSLMMLVLHGVHAFDIYRLSLHGFKIIKFAIFWGVFFLIVAFAEEFLWRGYSLFTFAKAAAFWPAAVLLSISFGVIHLLNPGESWNGILAAAFIGLFFCLTLRRTGNLWFAVGFHAAWDWGESYLYSVPDSGGVSPGRLFRSALHGPKWLTGGPVGPEGSVLLFILFVLLWFSFSAVYPKVKYGGEMPIEAVGA